MRNGIHLILCTKCIQNYSAFPQINCLSAETSCIVYNVKKFVNTFINSVHLETYS